MHYRCAAIGALAGPRVAKVAKKAARLIKRKIPSRHIQKIQRVWNVTKKVARKAVTKTRNAISKGKNFKKSAINMAKKAGRNGLREGRKGGMKAAGENLTVGNRDSKDLKQQTLNGFVSGFTSGTLSTIADPLAKSMKAKVIIGGYIGAVSGIMSSYSGNSSRTVHDVGFGAGSGVVNSLMTVLADSVKQEPQDIADLFGQYVVGYVTGVPDFAIGCISFLT